MPDAQGQANEERGRNQRYTQMPGQWQFDRSRPNGRRCRLAYAVLIIAALTFSLTFLVPTRLVVLNLSPSVASGFYVAVDAEPGVGQLVEFRMPRWRGPRAPQPESNQARRRTILKPIAAAGGAHIDTTGASLRIDGKRIARIQTHDSQGQRLTVWRANRRLKHDEFFVFSDRVWNSWDSRYFGPIQRRDIVAVRAALFTWGEP